MNTLRRFGVRWFTSLVYPHKPQMAEWLNQWAAQFALTTPDCLSTATFYPEPGAADYVANAIDGGARVFKAHIQVGDYDPNDPLLDGVWGVLEDAGTPVVIHCGSGPAPGTHTGPAADPRAAAPTPATRPGDRPHGHARIRRFTDICARHDNVRLDTTMAFTPFTEEMMPIPDRGAAHAS